MPINKINGNVPIKPSNQNLNKNFGQVLQQKQKEPLVKAALEQFKSELISNNQEFKTLVQNITSQKRSYKAEELLRIQLLAGNYAIKQQTYFKSLELGTNGIKSLLNMPV